MSRTITALFDSYADADAGRQRLLAADLDTDNVKIYDKSALGDTGHSSQEGGGIWASNKNAFLPGEDRHVYEEGMRRGGFLLIADVDNDEADEAIAALNESHLKSVDIEDRAHQWKSQGWMPAVAGAGMAGMGASAQQSSSSMSTQSSTLQGNMGRTDSQVDTSTRSIPVVKEQLEVGKREVERGGVRVYSHIVETPVNESIELREEHVDVQRRAVDKPVSASDTTAFREQSLEMREMAEEAVVQKTARVVEEVTINKEVSERQEQIHDTVRHTEVEVERFDGMAAGTGTNDDTYYRNHFQSNYGSADDSYEDYAPAYSYGSQMRGDNRYSGRQWDTVETDLRTDWESRNTGSGSTWEKVKAAVRHGWDRMTDNDGANRSN
jgi:uncharacterized protein (TIGR02271 family)